MSELAIRVRRTRAGSLSDRAVWLALKSWRETGQLPRGFELRRGNYGRRVGPRAWLKYVARVKETWRPGLVLCDFDDGDNLPPLLTIARRLKLARVRALWIRYDRTARGWHLIILLRQKVALSEAVALQAVLGSDPHREAFNIGRAIGLRRRPSSFWESRANVLYGGKLKWEAEKGRSKPPKHAQGTKQRRATNRRFRMAKREQLRAS